MSISSINTTVVSGGSGFNPSKMASKMAEKMISDFDPNNTGKVTKDQFMSGLTAKGVSTADATKIYNSIDTKGTGSITKSDIETAIKNGNLKPPSGGPQGAPGGASSSSKTYDAADTNKDGVVSAQEALIYALKQSKASATENSKTDPSKLGNNVDKQV